MKVMIWNIFHTIKKRINKPIIIEDFVWIGFGVTIMPGVTIGEGSVISSKSCSN